MFEDGPTLLGRNWLDKIKLKWAQIIPLTTTTYTQLLDKYSDVFNTSNSKHLKSIHAKIHVTKDAIPLYYKPRRIN